VVSAVVAFVNQASLVPGGVIIPCVSVYEKMVSRPRYPSSPPGLNRIQDVSSSQVWIDRVTHDG
jgi:hypothetical protein